MFCRPVLSTVVLSLALAGGTTSLGAAEANSGGAGPAPYQVNHWTSEDGLPQNRITSLAQTADGYIWIGTWFGLARFDGVRFTVFNEFNTPVMINQTINSLAVDTEGSLWIGTGDGLLRYRDRQFNRILLGEGLQNPKIWRLCPSRAGGVWIQISGSEADKFLLRSDGRVAAAELDIPEDQSVWSLCENDEENLLVATSHGLMEITRQGEVRSQPAPPGAPALPWGGVWQHSNGKHWWISSVYDLWFWRNGTWKSIQRGNSHSDRPHVMYEDRAGSLWVNRGEAGGFWRVTKDSAEAVRLGEYGAEKSVDCMLEDVEGHIWFGTSHGLFQLKPTLIRAVTTANGLPHDECFSVCEAPDGAVWVETASGVARIQNERAEVFPDEPLRTRRRSILADKSGGLWLGNGHNGVINWRPGSQTKRFWFFENTLVQSDMTLDSLCLDRTGRVWVGTGHGATWFEHGQPAADWGEFSLPTNSVRSIYQTRDGTMWFGTWQGGAVRWRAGTGSPLPSFGHPPHEPGASPLPSLSSPADGEERVADLSRRNQMEAEGRERSGSRVQGAKLSSGNSVSVGRGEGRGEGQALRFTTANGLADNRVFVFHEDADGALWIGTHNGLSRITLPQLSTSNSQPRIVTFRTEHGLLDNLINWLEEDDFGRFWFSCNRGIFRIDRSELNAVADGQKTRVNLAVYGTADGMPSPETNGEFQPAGCKTRDGRLWFPTQLGVAVIDPRAVGGSEATEVPPPVVIEQVVADGEVIFGDGVARSNPKSEIRSAECNLSPGRARVLRIGYTANSFADARRVRFRYRLSGRDADWRDAADERVAYYTDLKPGRYQFEVKAASPHGIWNETPAGFAFSLAPHFYVTWPFYGACGAFVLSTGLALHLRRVGRLRRFQRLEQQRALQEERARIAKDLHDDLGANLTGLALQLDVMHRKYPSSGSQQSQLAILARSTRGLVDNMREVVWAMNPQHDNVESLASFLGQYTENYLAAAGVRCRLELPSPAAAHPLSSNARHQLFLVVKEALHNVVRHARASEVQLCLEQENGELRLTIADDGCGLPPAEARLPRHGLDNMEKRVTELGGEFAAVRGDESGTRLSIRLPLGGALAALNPKT